MTESEAKKKWCPIVRQGDMNNPTGINRGYRQDFNCIGSACAMWRWKTDYIEPDEVHFMSNYPRPKTRIVVSETEGHCGLAGKP